MGTSLGETAPSALDARLAATLAQLSTQHLYRRRRVVEGAHGIHLRVDGRDCLNFCSNDYLGLAADPRVAAAASRALQHGTGSGAAALVSGYNLRHRELEDALAAYTGHARALLFSSGWAANLGVLGALLGKHDTLIADELNHASLIDGGRLSRARYVRVPHADVNAFRAALAAVPCGTQALLATDTVFSMDGDIAPLAELSAACQAQGVALMLDDAHGFGLRAPGAAPLPPHDVYVATLGKSLGCAGAFVAGSETLIEYLIQRARTWVFSTAPPPALAAAAREALRIVQAEPGRGVALHENIRRLRAGAQARGLELGASGTAIQPLILGDEARALQVSQRLYEAGYWVAAIRPPTVPKGTARLRITLSAAHAPAHIDGLLEALAEALR